MNKIIFFTKYTEKGPSSRYRSFQYEPYFKNYFSVEYYPFFDDNYLDLLFNNKKISKFLILKYIFRRIIKIIGIIGSNDLIVIEYELIPYFPPVFEYILKLFKVKYVLDFDDAIFHNYDRSNNFVIKLLLRNKIKNISKIASYIITGSPYLTKYFEGINSKVIEIPTSIVFEKYNKEKYNFVDSHITIGWLGSNTTSTNLILIKDVINGVKIKFPNVIFKFCGFNELLLEQFNKGNIEIFEWSPSNEMKFLNEIKIGIMPLEDNLFNRGKCGFKLIQYMAMGKPTISTPLEANVKINRNNDNLFASSEEEWHDTIARILNNLNYYERVGFRNKMIVEEFYSVEANYSNYIKIFNEILNVRN
jgi:glycosyltransferase involved in cell wall biosynthesis